MNAILFHFFFAMIDVAIFSIFLALLNSLILERVPQIRRYALWSVFALLFLPVSLFLVGGVFFSPFPLFVVLTFVYLVVSLYLYWKERCIDSRVKKMVLMDRTLTMEDAVSSLKIGEDRINEAIARLKSHALVPASTTL